MSVGSICRREVFVASVGESALAVAERMREHNVGTVVVLDERKKPVGVVTDRDLVLRVMAERRDPARTPVMHAMTVAPRSISETTPIELALGIMRSGKFRRIPVVAEDGSLAGILALDDVLELLAEEFQEIGGLLAAVEPHG